MWWTGVDILRHFWSYRKELYYVSLTFLFILSLPILAIVLITHTGIEAISDLLVDVNPITKKVQLYTPTGQLYKTLDINITWPVKGVITHEFGKPLAPFYLFHSGIDIANSKGKIGDPVTPAMSGKVVYAGEIFWGLGKHIIIDHGDNISTVYGHLDKILVEKDDEVKPGKVIGLEGSTGWSTGPHLHFEVRVFGVPVNPKIFL